jgi:hypothetical protein
MDKLEMNLKINIPSVFKPVEFDGFKGN